MLQHNLTVGDTITNAELTGIFKCGPQGGMRRSLRTDSLVIAHLAQQKLEGELPERVESSGPNRRAIDRVADVDVYHRVGSHTLAGVDGQLLGVDRYADE